MEFRPARCFQPSIAFVWANFAILAQNLSKNGATAKSKFQSFRLGITFKIRDAKCAEALFHQSKQKQFAFRVPKVCETHRIIWFLGVISILPARASLSYRTKFGQTELV
jgi:hypothetical protein